MYGGKAAGMHLVNKEKENHKKLKAARDRKYRQRAKGMAKIIRISHDLCCY